MVIQTTNNLPDDSKKTYLAFNEVGGTNVLKWKNPNGFSASWAIQVGKTGEEQTEIVLLGTATPAGTAGTLTGNTLYAHNSDTPIYPIKYDQIVYEKSASGTSGTATPITDGTIGIQADSIFTVLDDPSGTTTDAYRTYFRNSILNVTSIESDWITSSGPTFYSLSKITDRSKEKLWDSSYIKSNDTIHDWINEWLDEMTNSVIGVNEDYQKGTANIVFGTNGLGTITNADFKQLKRLWVTWDGGNSFYQSTKIQSNGYLPDQVFSQSHPYHDYVGNNVFRVHPSDVGGTAQIEYYQNNPKLVNDTDELPVPLRPYTKSFVDYCVAQALLKDNKTDEYQQKMSEALNAKEQFKTELSPRDKTGPDRVMMTDIIGGDMGGWF
jgi:hypothetical protein